MLKKNPLIIKPKMFKIVHLIAHKPRKLLGVLHDEGYCIK